MYNTVQVNKNWFCVSPWALSALQSCSFSPHRGHTQNHILFSFPPSTSHMLSHKVNSHQVLLHKLPPLPNQQQQQHHCINTHLSDKWSTLSVFSRQILSHPLAVSQPFDSSNCLRVSPRLCRMPWVLGKLQARRSGSRDLEGIGKTQLNGRSCLCLTLPT